MSVALTNYRKRLMTLLVVWDDGVRPVRIPSGHTVAATLLYGVLACYFTRRAHSWGARAAIIAAACAMVLLVAGSRLYLGAHYLSDVMAGMLEGCAWLAICVTSVATLRRRQAARARRTEYR